MSPRKLSDDDGCKLARRNRVLTLVGLTVLTIVCVVVEQSRHGSLAPGVMALVIPAFGLLLWMSRAAGREIVDAVWLDGDELRVEKRGGAYRVARKQIVSIDQPYRYDWTPLSRPRPIRVRLHGGSVLGSHVLFVPNRPEDIEALQAWLRTGNGVRVP